ncbi:Dps family protein [Terrilactibacillus laevilacticus]|uniref:Dps family protein n=1 Tax=Terrilactibacillus laevilacticus TaxID=1380157 RepID=A0ABW5PQN6_9BACI|nr:Dps family protein [Terrilactibacillus laevilacticus]
MENKEARQFLNQLLANLHVMYVKLHRYHWLIQGPHFFALHEKFEELYNEVAEDLDLVAERILSIECIPIATMSKFLDIATLKEAQTESHEEEILTQLKKDYEQLIQEIKDGIGSLETTHDEPTLDMLITLQGKYEKHVWMLRAILAKE